MFNAALPVLVSVTVCEALPPTLTLLKETEAGLTESCACVAVPIPLRLTLSGDPGASLVTETVPVVLPAAAGAKTTLKELVPPGFKVPDVKPLTENPAPEGLAAETDTGAVPEFVSVIVAVLLLPTRMLPKLTLAGFEESAPSVPVPLSAMARVGFEASVANTIVPEALPADTGAKDAVNVAFAPAAIV